MRTLSNIALFQVGWFASVLGAAHGYPFLGPAAVALGLAIHLRWFRARGDVTLLAASTLLGIVAESILLSAGVVAYAGEVGASSIPPPWIVAMWSNFAITLNHSLAWLQGNLRLAGAVGAVAGPAAYVAGSRLGAISLIAPIPAVLALAVVWGAALPLLFRLALRQSRSNLGRKAASIDTDAGPGQASG